MSDGLSPLIALLRSCNDEVRRNAAWAVTVCAVDEPTAIEICKLGYVPALVCCVLRLWIFSKNKGLDHESHWKHLWQKGQLLT